MSKTNSNSIRWGIIGCGDVTERKSGPAYQQTEGFELVAVMRRDFEKAKDYGKRHGVKKFYNDAQKLIDDPEVDAVYIATPTDSHLYYALKVAAAGKPCCLEKPMARSYEECLQIYEAFQKLNLPLFVAYYRRSLPRFLKVKSWLEEKKIGKVRHISWMLHQAPGKVDIERLPNWRTDKNVAPGGYFDDLASHGLDLFCYLLGDIQNASGFSLNQQGLYDAVDTVTGSWLHNSGTTGSGSWNFGTSGNLDQVQIFGSTGKITFSVFQDASFVLETERDKVEVQIQNPDPIQLPHVMNMKKDLFNNNFTHPSNGATALHTSWAMDRILGKVQ